MTSKAYSQNAFLHDTQKPSPEAVAPFGQGQGQGRATDNNYPRSRRDASVFDAVAGRVSAHGFIPKNPLFSSTRDTATSSARPAAPETVLFRRKDAPTRFAEYDIYFANERSTQADDLPESDLLKALHCYTSELYSRAALGGGSVDWKSLDETALIALGILMEEVTYLGQTSDLALTEARLSDMLLAQNRSGRASQSHVTRLGLKRNLQKDNGLIKQAPSKSTSKTEN